MANLQICLTISEITFGNDLVFLRFESAWRKLRIWQDTPYGCFSLNFKIRFEVVTELFVGKFKSRRHS